MTDIKGYYERHAQNLKRECEGYGVQFFRDERGYWARHNVGGVTGPHDNEDAAIYFAYWQWVEPPQKGKKGK